jgi:Fe2+ or Zn2+ uptake regulation protein
LRLSCNNIFYWYNKKVKRRNTKNKNYILDLFEKYHTLTAKEISERIPDAEKSTIYRNLKRFMSDKLLHEVHTNNKEKTYELSGHLHDHFICNDCDKIESINIKKILNDVIPSGSKIKKGGIVIYGICKKCFCK